MSKYSIILPVRNGGTYVKECVNSILSQSFTDFNFIVLDNNSTDGTPEWIESLKDDRIIIYRSTESLGIVGNWSRIVNTAKNEFITLIGHDDILDPHYLTVMDELIKKYPDASLYQTHFRYIDSKGDTIKKGLPMKEKQSPEEVLKVFLRTEMDVIGTGFMMRSKDYDALGGIPDYPNLIFADFELWINLARKSYMAVAKEESFAFRVHQSTTQTSADETLLKAFSRFVGYLEHIQRADPQLGKIVTGNVSVLLNFYCQGFTSRVLRTPMQKRKGQTVKAIINDFREYAQKLNPIDDFNPLNNFTVRLALYIDSNFMTRSIFLLFKQVYSKPIVRGN